MNLKCFIEDLGTQARLCDKYAHCSTMVILCSHMPCYQLTDSLNVPRITQGRKLTSEKSACHFPPVTVIVRGRPLAIQCAVPCFKRNLLKEYLFVKNEKVDSLQFFNLLWVAIDSDTVQNQIKFIGHIHI